MNRRQRNNYDLLENDSENSQNALYGASALANIVGSTINYNLLKSQNATLGIQANQVELSALEQVNQMREQFSANIGKVQYNAVQRGIKSSSGSVQENLEKSSKNFGEDVQTIKKNANRQATVLRGQELVNNKIAKAQMWGNISKALFSLSDNLKEEE